MKVIEICSNCKSDDIVYVNHHGDRKCRNCGELEE